MSSSLVGEITVYTSLTQPPEGWLTCDGSLLSIGDYPELYSVIGTIYGGDGRTNFALPDLQTCTGLGASDEHKIGEEGGNSVQKYTINNQPAHSHGASWIQTASHAEVNVQGDVKVNPLASKTMGNRDDPSNTYQSAHDAAVDQPFSKGPAEQAKMAPVTGPIDTSVITKIDLSVEGKVSLSNTGGAENSSFLNVFQPSLILIYIIRVKTSPN